MKSKHILVNLDHRITSLTTTPSYLTSKGRKRFNKEDRREVILIFEHEKSKSAAICQWLQHFAMLKCELTNDETDFVAGAVP